VGPAQIIAERQQIVDYCRQSAVFCRSEITAFSEVLTTEAHRTSRPRVIQNHGWRLEWSTHRKLMICSAAPAVSPVARLWPLVYQTRHAASQFRSYDFSDMERGRRLFAARYWSAD